jgi:hypothetical protein
MRQQDRPPTPEQIEIARWTASLGAVTAEALAQRTSASVRSARAKLMAARRRKLLASVRPLYGRPTLFTTTRDGLRACEAGGIQMCAVSASNANHLIACAVAAAALERRYPHHRLIGERELRCDERELGHPLASAKLAASRRAQNRLHRPDLVLCPLDRDGDLPLAVEVELTVKSPERLVEICRAWARCRTIAGVIYFAPEDVQRALRRAVAKARAFERVVIVPLDSLLGKDTWLARQPQGRLGGGPPSKASDWRWRATDSARQVGLKRGFRLAGQSTVPSGAYLHLRGEPNSKGEHHVLLEHQPRCACRPSYQRPRAAGAAVW